MKCVNKRGFFLQQSLTAQIEKWIYYCMCGFALCSSLSIAAGNFFCGAGLFLFLFRLYYKHDDLYRRLCVDRTLLWVIGSWVGVTFVSIFFSFNPIGGLKTFADFYLYRTAGFFLVLIAVREKKQLGMLVRLVSISVLINNAVTLLQAGGFWWEIKPRPSGFISFMAQGGILSAMIPVFLLVVIFLIKQRYPWQRIAGAGIGVGISIAALLVNLTRGAWLAAAFTSMVVVFLAMGNWKKTLAGSLIIVVFVSGCFVFNQNLRQREGTLWQMEFQSNSERLLMWTSAWNMFQDHPLLGVGFGAYDAEYKTKYILPEAKERQQGHAHSNVMQMLGDRGALGFLTFMAMWFYLMYFCLRGWRQTRQYIYLGLLSVVLGIMLQGLTEYNLGTTLTSKFYWLGLGICLQWIRINREEMEK